MYIAFQETDELSSLNFLSEKYLTNFY